MLKVSKAKFSTNLLKKKICCDINHALEGIKNGDRIFVGGAVSCGVPEHFCNALVQKPLKNLTLISFSTNARNYGPGIFFQREDLIRKLITSHIGTCPLAEKQYLAGKLDLEIIPQGTLAEKIRAGGAGIPAFYVKTGIDTLVEKGGIPIRYKKDQTQIESSPKKWKMFNNEKYLLEEAINADVALIKAQQADPYGNLCFNKTARNFNEIMAKAAKLTIAEVEEIVPIGALKPDHIHLSGVYVNKIYKGLKFKKEVLLYNKQKDADLSRQKIAKRAALEVKNESVASLGTGLPVMISTYVPKNFTVFVHSDPGILGLGSYPDEENIDFDLINAAGEPSTIIPGASVFTGEESFGMIRSGRIDVAFIGAMQVSEFGDLANWMIPKKLIKGIGGAMDLVAAPHTKIVVCMEHLTKNNKPKILKECTLPLTGQKCVDVIITEKAVFYVDPSKGLELVEIANTATIDEIKESTDSFFRISSNLKTF